MDDTEHSGAQSQSKGLQAPRQANEGEDRSIVQGQAPFCSGAMLVPSSRASRSVGMTWTHTYLCVCVCVCVCVGWGFTIFLLGLSVEPVWCMLCVCVCVVG